MSKRYALLIAPLIIVMMVPTFMAGILFERYGAGGPALEFAPGTDTSNFGKVKRLIGENYVQPVSDGQLVTGAIKGLVEGTGDPYSEYLTKDEATALNQALDGTVEGVGIEIGLKNDAVTVIAPLPGSPAARAGILAGDIVISVDGEPVSGRDLDEVAKKIRGPKGSTVKLEVRTPGQATPRPLTLTRDTVKAASLNLVYRDTPTGQVAVLQVARFGNDTKQELDRAIGDIQSKKPRGVVLDLRSNPGGFLEGAITLTSVFLSSGDVVREQFAKGKSETRSVGKDGRLANVPLAVLVDRGSASASEITAGALRDNKSTALVGEKTYGKGSVQELKELGGGAVLKLTIAEWLTPKGTSISKQGLKPDVEVPSDNPEAQLQAAIMQLR